MEAYLVFTAMLCQNHFFVIFKIALYKLHILYTCYITESHI